VALSDEDVREILRIIDESTLTELQIETEGFSLHVRKDGGDADASGRPRAREVSQRDAAGSPRGGPEASASQPAPAAEPQDGLATITAPMLGTFYRAEAPGKPAFVEIGQRVEPDTIVCIIEVMKMMNSVTAGVSGTIAAVVPDNAELVEYGQPLFRVEPT
jgi:acetyl-CoA carboxylase biotin carboxyl carrier protein